MSQFIPIITIFIVMLIGFLCYKIEVFSKTQRDGLELLLLKVIMPSYLFIIAYENDLSALLNTQYITAYIITLGILLAVVKLVFIKNPSSVSVCIRIFAASYVNATIYTLPIITILLKDSTSAIIANMLQIIVIQPVFIILLNKKKFADQPFSKIFLNIIKTPLITMPLTGILLNHLQIAIPTPFLEALSNIGKGASGIALFLFGLTLGSAQITQKCLQLNLLIIVFSKNLMHPFIALCVAYYMRLETYWFNSLVITASAPTAFVVYLISKQFSAEEEFIKKVVAISSMSAIISLVIITIIIT